MQPQSELSFVELVLNASFLVQCVMLFLLALSIISWTIIISRHNQYRAGRIKADEFEERFWSGVDLNTLFKECMQRPEDLFGLEVIYSAGFREFVRLVNSGPANQDVVMDGTYRQMKVACSREIEILEKSLPTLATIGSISPYIGLFGTVWGIMHAFIALAAVKNATLAMVAPPIAEALIATAMGLFAAIPAVMFYNRFVTKVEALENRYYNFMDEFSTILNRRLVTIRNQLNHQKAENQGSMDNSMYQEQGGMEVDYAQNNKAPANQVNGNLDNTTSPDNAGNANGSLNQNNSAPNNLAVNQPNNLKNIGNANNPTVLNQNQSNLNQIPDPNAQVQAQAMAQSLHQNVVNGRTSNNLNKGRVNNAQMNMMQNNNASLTANLSANASNANVNAQLNDPRMMANYRGVVPPRNPNQNANGQMANNGFKKPVKNDAPFYKGSSEFNKVRQQNNNNDLPHYIAPGGQTHNVRRAPNQANPNYRQE